MSSTQHQLKDWYCLLIRWTLCLCVLFLIAIRSVIVIIMMAIAGIEHAEGLTLPPLYCPGRVRLHSPYRCQAQDLA